MNDDATINLREEDNDAEFKINHVEGVDQEYVGQEAVGNISAASVSELEDTAMNPHEKVKLKFEKFVALVASHDYEDVFDRHRNEDVIISTDLLTDLANAHEEKGDRKIPLIFIFGIILGIVITWILLKT